MMRRAIAAVLRARRYGARDPRLAAEALVCRVLLPVLKRSLPIRVLSRWMWVAPREESHPRQRERVEQLRDFAANAGRVFVSTNCLERSLFFYRQLSRAGAAPTLILGASAAKARVAGHAWVEVDGAPFADTESAAYVPVVAFAGRGTPAAAGASAPA